jgi:hypothetical protein
MPTPREFHDAFLAAAKECEVGVETVVNWGHDRECPHFRVPEKLEGRKPLSNVAFTNLMNGRFLATIAGKLNLQVQPQSSLLKALSGRDSDRNSVTWRYVGIIRNGRRGLLALCKAETPLLVFVTALSPLARGSRKAESYLAEYSQTYLKAKQGVPKGQLLVIFITPEGKFEFYLYPGFEKL